MISSTSFIVATRKMADSAEVSLGSLEKRFKLYNRILNA